MAVFRKTRTDAWYFQSEGLSGIDSGHMMLVVCDSSVHPSIVLVIPKVFLPIDYALFAATSIVLIVTENLFKNKVKLITSASSPFRQNDCFDIAETP